MTGTEARLTAEQRFHDAQAADRSVTFRDAPARLRFADADFLDHETWVRPAFARLGDLRGKTALDYGCGHGMAAVAMARGGAVVSAFDLSPGYVYEAERRATANRVTVRLSVADAEELPYRNRSFDVVWGNAVLHHLDLDRAGAELKRVLKPGGVAVFCEPWGGNPLLAFTRRFVPYPGKSRTADERSLSSRHLAPLRRHFPDLHVEGFQLAGMVRRVWPGRRLRAAADALDRKLLRNRKWLENWCRYAVLTLRAG